MEVTLTNYDTDTFHCLLFHDNAVGLEEKHPSHPGFGPAISSSSGLAAAEGVDYKVAVALKLRTWFDKILGGNIGGYAVVMW